MFRIALLFSALTAAFAFSPARVSRQPSALKMSFENEIGVLPPVGFWDPLGLSTGKDQATFNKYREAELKHGRVAMLAVIGYIVQASSRLPGAIDLDGTTFDSIPNGIAAIGAVPSLGWLQITASIGYWELLGWEQKADSPIIGNFGFGDKFLKQEDEVEYRTKEIQNGRLAMLGIMELLTHDIAKPAGEGLFVLHHF